MHIDPTHIYAVATGDIVGSTTLSTTDRPKLREVMRQAGDRIVELWPEDLPVAAALFAGDRWQIFTPHPGSLLRIAVYYRAALIASDLGIDTRMAIGIGTVDYIPEANIVEGEGPAFRRSGRTLDGMGKGGAMVVRAGDDPREPAWNGALRLLDALIRHQWTPSRARAVTGATRGLTQEQIGHLWAPSITQQSVADHLAEAEWKAIDDLLATWSRDWQ